MTARKYNRVLAVGDIHGCITPFLSLYETLELTDDDLIIFLGDYIDRGPESLAALEWIGRESLKPNVIALRGNHEHTLLDCIAGRFADRFFNIGIGTVREVRKAAKTDPTLPLRIVQTIRRMPLYHRMTIGDREYVFCHAGVDARLNPDPPIELQSAEQIVWVREEFYRHYEGAATYVVGHTPVQYLHYPPLPIKFSDRNIWMLDTGSCCMEDGRISCLDVMSGHFWQTKPIGWSSLGF